MFRQYLAQAEGAQEVFTALNTAGLTDVAVVLVGKNVVVEDTNSSAVYFGGWRGSNDFAAALFGGGGK